MSKHNLKYSIWMEKSTEVKFKRQLEQKATRVEHISFEEGVFLTESGLSLHFVQQEIAFFGEYSVIGLHFTSPIQLDEIGSEIDQLKQPISIHNKEGESIMIIPSAAQDEFGEPRAGEDTYEFRQLADMNVKNFTALFLQGSGASDDQLILNLNYLADKDVFTQLPHDEMINRGRYDYILVCEDLEIDEVFFKVLGVQNFEMQDAGGSGGYALDIPEVKVFASQLEFESGLHWYFTIYLEDQGLPADSKITEKILKNIVSHSIESYLYFVHDHDEMATLLPANELTIRAGKVKLGKSMNFSLIE